MANLTRGDAAGGASAVAARRLGLLTPKRCAPLGDASEGDRRPAAPFLAGLGDDKATQTWYAIGMKDYRWIAGIGAAIVVAGGVWSGALSVDAATTAAQEGERAEQLRQRLEEARTRLNLTDEQVEQVRPILRGEFEAMLEVFEEHGIDIGDRSGSGRRLRFRQLRRLQQDLNAVREQTLEDLGDVLSDAQREVYQEIQEENREAMRERLGQRR